MYWNQSSIIKCDEGIDGCFVHFFHYAQIALIGIDDTVTNETLPCWEQFVLLIHIGDKHKRFSTNKSLGFLLVRNIV